MRGLLSAGLFGQLQGILDSFHHQKLLTEVRTLGCPIPRQAAWVSVQAPLPMPSSCEGTLCKAEVIAQALGSLPPVWENWMEFLVPGIDWLSLSCVGICKVGR